MLTLVSPTRVMPGWSRKWASVARVTATAVAGGIEVAWATGTAWVDAVAQVVMKAVKETAKMMVEILVANQMAVAMPVVAEIGTAEAKAETVMAEAKAGTVMAEAKAEIVAVVARAETGMVATRVVIMAATVTAVIAAVTAMVTSMAVTTTKSRT